jgi:hypothetical protein
MTDICPLEDKTLSVVHETYTLGLRQNGGLVGSPRCQDRESVIPRLGALASPPAPAMGTPELVSMWIMTSFRAPRSP